MASTRRSPRPSNSNGISSTTSGAPRCAARFRKARCFCPTSGCTMASSLRNASLLPKTRAPSAWRSSTPFFTTPGNAASIGGSAIPPGAWSACTAASASYTGTPICRSILAAVDLPMPIEPVRPTMTIRPCPGSGDDDGLTGGLAAFEVDMRLAGLGQRIALVDGDLDLLVLHQLEQRLGRRFEGLAVGRVGTEAGTREIE